jgi:hypothetical protein
MCIRRRAGDSMGVTAEDELERAATEATFREANERIREAQRELDHRSNEIVEELDGHAIVRKTNPEARWPPRGTRERREHER